MTQLLDTHALLWFLQGAPAARPVRKRIEAGRNVFSVASIWEAAIKVSLGKLVLPYSVDKLPALCAENGVEIIDVGPREALRVATLAWHHRDPFDRLLVAQCFEHGLVLVSRDPHFDAYGIERVWA